MYYCKDENEQEYLFKPSVRKNTDIYEPYRAEAQVLASKLQQIISPDTAVKCEKVEIDGIKGTIQPKIECDNEKMARIEDYYFSDVPLDEKIARQFMNEYVVDYLLGNYDSHFRNFIVDKNGNLRGIDKEQSLKYICNHEIQGDLRFEQFNPNAQYGEYPPIYEKIFRDIDNGKMSADNLKEINKAIDKVKNIPRQEYVKLFEPYIDAIILSNPEKSREQFYESILSRYDSLENIQNMIKDYSPKLSLTELSSIVKKLKNQRAKLMEKKKKERKMEYEKGNSRIQ